MILARVTGTVVSTQKNRKLEGAKLLRVSHKNAPIYSLQADLTAQ